MYILKRDGVVFYVGITNDMKKRLAQHKEPQVRGQDIVMEMVKKIKHDNRKTLELLEQQAISFYSGLYELKNVNGMKLTVVPKIEWTDISRC